VDTKNETVLSAALTEVNEDINGYLKRYCRKGDNFETVVSLPFAGLKEAEIVLENIKKWMKYGIEKESNKKDIESSGEYNLNNDSSGDVYSGFLVVKNGKENREKRWSVCEIVYEQGKEKNMELAVERLLYETELSGLITDRETAQAIVDNKNKEELNLVLGKWENDKSGINSLVDKIGDNKLFALVYEVNDFVNIELSEFKKETSLENFNFKDVGKSAFIKFSREETVCNEFLMKDMQDIVKNTLDDFKEKPVYYDFVTFNEEVNKKVENYRKEFYSDLIKGMDCVGYMRKNSGFVDKNIESSGYCSVERNGSLVKLRKKEENVYCLTRDCGFGLKEAFTFNEDFNFLSANEFLKQFDEWKRNSNQLGKEKNRGVKI
jgi:hypothetical protein